MATKRKRQRPLNPSKPVETKNFSKVKLDDILEYFGPIAYHASPGMMEETSSWKEVLKDLIDEMNSVDGPGLDIAGADELLNRFPMENDSDRQKLIFLPLINLNCSQYDMNTGLGITSAFEHLNKLVKTALEEICEPDFVEGKHPANSDAIYFAQIINSFCSAMEDISVKQKHTGSDNDTLHNILVLVIQQLMKLSIPPSVSAREGLYIRTNGDGKNLSFHQMGAKILSDTDDDDFGDVMKEFRVRFSGKPDIIVEERSYLRAPLVVEVKSVLHNFTDGPLSSVDSPVQTIGTPVQYNLLSSDTVKEASDQVNARMKDINRQHFLQLLGCLKCYSVPEPRNVKAFGMCIVMNRVYFTSLFVAPNKDGSDTSEQSHDPIKFIYAPNTGRCPSVNGGYEGEFSPTHILGMQYHMIQTKGLNWLNANHCRAMIAFIQYLIRRNSGKTQ